MVDLAFRPRLPHRDAHRLRWRGATILTAPSFSNPSLDRVAPSFFRLLRRAAPAIAPDTLAIERLLPPEADSASVILVGHGPPPGAGRADLALLCAATSENVPHAPDSLVRVIRPRYALVGHWESFFRQQTLPLYLNPASDLDAFFAKLSDAMPPRSGWLLPTPRTTVRVCVCKGG